MCRIIYTLIWPHWHFVSLWKVVLVGSSSLCFCSVRLPSFPVLHGSECRTLVLEGCFEIESMMVGGGAPLAWNVRHLAVCGAVSPKVVLSLILHRFWKSLCRLWFLILGTFDILHQITPRVGDWPTHSRIFSSFPSLYPQNSRSILLTLPL